uniref:Uncharacterized protein n=1 Tax=Meloidogyne javanica TaxID=6303 RepID=A0A915MFH1_MELJA
MAREQGFTCGIEHENASGMIMDIFENNNEKVNQQEGADIRVQRLSLRRGQNLITWTVAVNPVLSSRMERIRIIRIDIS